MMVSYLLYWILAKLTIYLDKDREIPRYIIRSGFWCSVMFGWILPLSFVIGLLIEKYNLPNPDDITHFLFGKDN
jgi:hypothetical protein